MNSCQSLREKVDQSMKLVLFDFIKLVVVIIIILKWLNVQETGR